MVNTYTKGTYVKLHTSDSWDCLHGIVDDRFDGIIAVFCPTMPLWRYFVNPDDAKNVLEVIA